MLVIKKNKATGVYKCVRDSDGALLPWTPRAHSIIDGHYHFEECTRDEIAAWTDEYNKTGKCNHPCGHDEDVMWYNKSVCEICGDSDLF